MQLVIKDLAQQDINMASESGDYEEDWEITEPSINKKDLVSTTGGQLYPDEKDERNATRDVELTRQKDDTPVPKLTTLGGDLATVAIKTKLEKTAAVTTLEEVPTSEGTQSSDENIVASTAPEKPYPRTTDLQDLVRIHGQHYDSPMQPPVPVNVSVGEASKSPSRPDIGALQARVAAKRVAEFRRGQELKAASERAQESEWIRKRREIRRSNDLMHQALGVAGLSVQEHLRLARRRHKQEMKEKDIVASLERQNRWYNNILKRPHAAPHHLRELQLHHSQKKWELERRIQRRQKSIRANQLELQEKAQAIIAKASGAYVHGSYLLKVTHHTIKQQNQPPQSDRKDIEPDENNIAAE
ncbi:hypothetical protein V7S43_008305 [Phytophthora oleae]|uniref:ALMS motif domain-containing protein n=1 Tax=Phytophthora oleae TaxID=2107226 RepID=A0ABD3FK49_9STRA